MQLLLVYIKTLYLCFIVTLIGVVLSCGADKSKLETPETCRPKRIIAKLLISNAHE